MQSGPASPMQAPEITVKATWEETPDKSTHTRVLLVNMDIPFGLHINSNSPPDEFLIPTTVKVEGPEGVYELGEVIFPPSQPYNAEYFDAPLPVYMGLVKIKVPVEFIKLSKNTEDLNFKVTVGWQACTDTVCYPPSEKVITLTAVPDQMGLTPISPAKSAPSPTQETELQHHSRDITFLGYTIGSTQDAGLPLFLLLAFIAGALLNVTPCVLPVVPLKVLSIIQHGGHRSRSLMLGLVFSLGIITSFILLAIPVIVLTMSWGEMFTFWWVHLGIAVLMLAMSLSLLGLFTIQAPARVQVYQPKIDNISGSFLFGGLTTVLAAPCIGPIFITILSFATQVPWFIGLSIFAMLGVGMSAPYFVLLLFPKLIDYFPRSGYASELFKQTVALMILAVAALMFFWSVSTSPLEVQANYSAWATAVLLVFAGLWLVTKAFKHYARKPLPLLACLALGLLISVPMLFYVNTATSNSRETIMDQQAQAKADELKFDQMEDMLKAINAAEDWRREPELVAQMQTMNLQSSLPPAMWRSYSQRRVQRALDQGKIVVVEFTATWCVNCKAVELVLQSDEVESALRERGAVTFIADLTQPNRPGSPSEEAWAKIKSFGFGGPPLTLVMHPDGRIIQLDSIFTASAFLEALKPVTAVSKSN